MLNMRVDGNQKRGFVFQVADKVTRPLGSVSRMISKGNQVVFDSRGSYIYHRPTGAVTWLRQEDGVFVLDAWVERAPF